MKKLYLLRNVYVLTLLLSTLLVRSQTVNVPYQFYLDANNNCNYDGGETLLYNLPVALSFTYTDISSVVTSSI